MSKSVGVTIRDVAGAAGLSVSTVSQVLSGNRPTSMSARRRVEAAVARLNYRPNAVAQSLVRRRSFAFGLVIPDISNPFFPALARGAEDRIRAEGYSLVLGNSDYDPSREAGYLDLLFARQLAGVICCLGEEPRPVMERLKRAAGDGLPVVLVHSPTEGVPTVCADDSQGGRLAAEHLLDLGHRRIGVVSARPSSAMIVNREAAFLQVLAASGAAADRSGVPVAFGDHQIVGGRRAAQELLAQNPSLTALFVLNDLMAIGALEAARALGRRVPEDLSIVGFDDITFAALTSPPLTTVAQPIRQLGERAADLLLSLIDGTGRSAARGAELPALVLPTILVVRCSTRRLAGAAS